MKGTVKFFNEQKHFGFITCEDGSQCFVHESGLTAGTHITEGDNVEFETENGDKGLKAAKVTKV